MLERGFYKIRGLLQGELFCVYYGMTFEGAISSKLRFFDGLPRGFCARKGVLFSRVRCHCTAESPSAIVCAAKRAATGGGGGVSLGAGEQQGRQHFVVGLLLRMPMLKPLRKRMKLASPIVTYASLVPESAPISTARDPPNSHCVRVSPTRTRSQRAGGRFASLSGHCAAQKVFLSY